MILDYQISEEDYVAAAALAARKRSWIHTVRYIRLAVVGVFLVIGAGASLVKGGNANESLIPLLLLIVIFGTIFFGRKWFYARAYRRNTNLQLRQRADINDRTLRFSNERSDSTSGWEAYSKFAENDKTFILFQKGNQIFIPIPKREMGSMQVEELRVVMQQGLSRGTNLHLRR